MLLTNTGYSIKTFREEFLRTARKHGAGEELALFVTKVFYPDSERGKVVHQSASPANDSDDMEDIAQEWMPRSKMH